jgi:hypothetical protein
VCKNPLLADERARKRSELLSATEAALAKVQAATLRKARRLRGRDRIGLAVGAVLKQHKMAKHFDIIIDEDRLTVSRNHAAVAAEAALDGIYVVRTSLAEDHLDTSQTVAAYKQLATVERAFRSLKTVDLEIRPVHHRAADRVRAHVFLCMLAYYVEWHMRQALAPILFDDHDRAAGAAARRSVVAPAQRSDAALRKAAGKRTDSGLPVHSFRTLLADLATVSRNTMALTDGPETTFLVYPELTALQRTALQLLGLSHKL